MELSRQAGALPVRDTLGDGPEVRIGFCCISAVLVAANPYRLETMRMLVLAQREARP